MGRIDVVGDDNTVNCFRLAGLKNVHSVRDLNEAEDCLRNLLEVQDPMIILVTERLIDSLMKHDPKILEAVLERKRPLVVPIPEMSGSVTLKTDLIVELIRSKTGIEVKL
ncbi:MAG: hypothetical protein JSV35_01550 [Candidatus Bathyarchaeota archaeon]|nr:MAG: hypothetical protein JSV35_01550 [Candidatus Bathyarchaeota archaeon]